MGVQRDLKEREKKKGRLQKGVRKRELKRANFTVRTFQIYYKEGLLKEEKNCNNIVKDNIFFLEF